MNRTSRACSRVLLGVYFTSVARNIMLRKLPLYERSLSGYAYGMPTEWRRGEAGRGGALARTRENWLRRAGACRSCRAPGENGERAPTALRGHLDLAQVSPANRAILDRRLVLAAGPVVGDREATLRHAQWSWKWPAKDNRGRAWGGNGGPGWGSGAHNVGRRGRVAYLGGS